MKPFTDSSQFEASENVLPRTMQGRMTIIPFLLGKKCCVQCESSTAIGRRIDNTNYRCYRQVIDLGNSDNHLFDVEIQQEPEFEGRCYYKSNTAVYICVRCATVFTGILQTLHYHFKAGQVQVIPCAHVKTR